MNASDIKVNNQATASSADKILQAATMLFAQDNFSAVSIKQIAAASGVNSALISYYFGGKKNLYQEVLYTEADKFLKLQDKIRARMESPLRRLRSYVDTIAEIAIRYGISESAVQMRLNRTRSKLAMYLSKEGIKV